MAERIENDVIAVAHQYSASIHSAPTAEMLQAAGNRTSNIQKDALAEAKAALKKAQKEKTALEDAAVQALTGESNGYLIHQWLDSQAQAESRKRAAES